MMKIVAIRDIKSDLWGQPNFVAAKGQAIRSFGDECAKTDQPLGQHPEDYELYYLGEYDETKGHFHSIEPEQIAVGSNYKR